MGVQHLRFGPVEFQLRGHRVYFWPQARGKVAGAVAEVVAADEDSRRARCAYRAGQRAVQGLLAAEGADLR